MSINHAHIGSKYAYFTQKQLSQTKFAFDLLREMNCSKSVVFSPISISFCFAMTLMGAKDKTAEEIQTVIAEDMSFEHFSNLYSFIDKNKNVVNMMNIGYCSNNIKLINEFEVGIHENFKGIIKFIDFTVIDKAANEINKFVADSTENRVINFIESDMLKGDIGLMLVSTFNFDGEWEESFKLQSNMSTFFSFTTSTKQILMMEEEFLCSHVYKKLYQFVKIPYKGRSFFMCILLPNERFGLSEILKNIDATEILILMGNKMRLKGKIVIPKFTIDSSFNFSDKLKNLGIKEAFDKDKANFSGISETNMFISSVLHKAMINVTETGTTAASAAGVTFQYLSTKPTLPFEFIADHPFLYFITDKERNVYFVGTFCG